MNRIEKLDLKKNEDLELFYLDDPGADLTLK